MGQPRVEEGVTMHFLSEKGFSLAETIVSLGILATGVIGAAGVLMTGMANLSGSPADVISAQKATQAIESVFGARDSKRLTWAQIANVSNGGIFLDGPQTVYKPGADGLVGTADDTAAGIDAGSAFVLERVSPVVVDLGSGGLWRWAGSWQQLTSTDPSDLATRPEHCGAPVVDAEGRVAGLLIARAPFIESLILPSIEVKAAIEAYVKAVKAKTFPGPEHSF